MSYVVFQVGQCGNQLGHKFFETLNDLTSKKQSSKNYEFIDESDSRFFSYDEKEEKRFAHAILLDTEIKVIQSITNPLKSSWHYRKESYKMFHGGAGNNWAMGYKSHGPAFQDFLLDAVRKEIELCDQLNGFLIFGSVAGGTGSGVGSYVSEILREEFPSVSIANISIWPFQKGEVTVQVYNAVLSLAALQNSSDAIFIFENDWLLKLCNQKMGIKKPSMHDLNYAICQQLLNLLLPVGHFSDINHLTLNDLLSYLVPHPQFKLIGLRSVPQEPISSLPFSSYTWPGLLRSLRRMLLYSTVIDEVYGQNNITNYVASPPVSLKNLLVLRGRDSESADYNFLHKPSLPYASWVPASSRIKVLRDSNLFLSYDKTALLANNGLLSLSCIDKAVAKAWKMFHYKAYLHHYEQYGLSHDDFMASFMNVEQIISSYKSLTV